MKYLSGCVCALLTAGKGWPWSGGGEGGEYNQYDQFGEQKDTNLDNKKSSISNINSSAFIHIVIAGPRPSEFWPC